MTIGTRARYTAILLLLLLPGCAIKRHWVSSEAAYDNWAFTQCVRTHQDLGMTEEELHKFCDPNWKPCPNGSTNPSCN